jgi:hypothetical protein
MSGQDHIGGADISGLAKTTQGNRKRKQLASSHLSKLPGKTKKVIAISFIAHQLLQIQGRSRDNTGEEYEKILNQPTSIKAKANMDQRRVQEDQEEETVGDNFLTTQHLAMHLESYSTTLNFTLETLSHH